MMNTTESQLGAILLCGGQSRRMGSDKSRLVLPTGRTLAAEMVSRLSSALPVGQMVIAGRRDQSWPDIPDDIERVVDSVDDHGPLAGIVAGLQALRDRAELVFVLAVDSPGFVPNVVPLLVNSIGDAVAAVPRIGTQIYPLTAVYRTRPALLLAKRALAEGQLRVIDWTHACEPIFVEEATLRAVDPQLASLAACNNPDDWQRWTGDSVVR